MARDRARTGWASASRPGCAMAAWSCRSRTPAPRSSPAGSPVRWRASHGACTPCMATTRASRCNARPDTARAPPWRFRMRSPTAVIAEDEPLLRAELRDSLAAVWPALAIVAEAANGTQALQALQAHRPQILFLDIEMPGMTGLQVAAQASRHCHVVFITAYDRHACAAFEQGAVDYVLKPFSTARLAITATRLQERLGAQPADLDGL